MKHKYTLFILSISVILLLTAFNMYRNYFHPHPAMKPYQLSIQHSDTLHVTYIGDSWAFMHRPYDELTTQKLTEALGRPVLFRSYGICGLTSSEIYEQLCSNDSLRTFLSKGCDVCIVSAGINDCYKKMPLHYYHESMRNIIDFLLFNHIHPILQEIPDFDTQKTFERQTLSKKLLRHFSMLAHDIPIDCKQLFRESLDSLLIEQDYGTSVTVLRYKDWNRHFQRDLEEMYQFDGLHLNERGYAALDSCITKCLKTH